VAIFLRYPYKPAAIRDNGFRPGLPENCRSLLHLRHVKLTDKALARLADNGYTVAAGHLAGKQECFSDTGGMMNFRSSAILALGIVVGCFLLGRYLYTSRISEQSIRVVGAATRPVESDVVKWRLAITRTSSEQEISDAYQRIHDDVQRTIGRLKARGIKDENITIQAISTNQLYGAEGRKAGYNVQQAILIISRNVSDLEQMAVDPKSVLDPGMVLGQSDLEYFLSDLPKTKKALLAEAMKDARSRAEEMAAASGVRITKLLTSSVGVFQITEPFSTEISDYGVYNTSTKQKDITVTVRASFAVE
jgi:hypothetical protein